MLVGLLLDSFSSCSVDTGAHSQTHTMTISANMERMHEAHLRVY